MPTPAYPPPIPADNKADTTPLTGDHPAHHNALAEAIDSIITNKLGTAAASLASTYDAIPGIAAGVIYVDPVNGNDARSGASEGLAKATIAAALTAVGTAWRGVVKLLAGTHDVGNGRSFSGYRCTPVGLGVGVTIVTASTQTSPVIDMNGWVGVESGESNFLRQQEFGGFTIKGSGSGVSTGAKIGLRLDSGFSGLIVRPVTVYNTDDIGLDVNGCQFTNFEKVIVHQPLSAGANNTPYARFKGAFNGNDVTLLLRNPNVPGPTATDPVGGCLVISDDTVNIPADNRWRLQGENHKVPDGGTVVMCQAENQVFDCRWFDVAKVSGATNTKFVDIKAPTGIAEPASSAGGNLIDIGVIQGSSPLDMGVILRQNFNTVRARRQSGGPQVVFDTGVQSCVAIFDGSRGTPPAAASYTDNSGNATNSVFDMQAQKLVLGDVSLYRGSAGRWKTDSGLDVVGTVTSATKVLPTADQLPWRVFVDPFVAEKASVGAWTRVVSTTDVYNGFRQSTGAQNDSIDFTVMLAAGTWSFHMLHDQSTNRGIYDVQLDDGAGAFTSLGTIDGYNAAATHNVLGIIASIVVASTIKRTLRLLLSTKNASSSSYFGAVQSITFRRDA